MPHWELDPVPAVGDPTALFSSARATMCPLAKVNHGWPFNDAWLRTSLEEARRQAPRNGASILDAARELGIRDAQVVEDVGARRRARCVETDVVRANPSAEKPEV